jgi:hypothetical protein
MSYLICTSVGWVGTELVDLIDYEIFLVYPITFGSTPKLVLGFWFIPTLATTDSVDHWHIDVSFDEMKRCIHQKENCDFPVSVSDIW